MGWRGTLRATEAAARRAERESQRRHRQMLRDDAARTKMEIKQRSAYDVELYENTIARLLSVHKEAPGAWDWNQILNTPPPVSPERSTASETRAQTELSTFRPGLMDKLLGRTDRKRILLEQAVEQARNQDEQRYQSVYQEYYGRHTDWEERRQLASRILGGDTHAYVDALGDYNPFADLNEMGAAIEIEAHNATFLSVRVQIGGSEIVPSEIKTLTSTSKLSVKPMPRSKSQEIFREFVCGTVLRVGREVFAFLPVENIIATILAKILDTRTGREGMAPILSVAMARKTFDDLNFNLLNPVDAMQNFEHRMQFNKSSGFGPVDLIPPPKSGDDEKRSATRDAPVRTTTPALSPKPEPGPDLSLCVDLTSASIHGRPNPITQLLDGTPNSEGCLALPISKLAGPANIPTDAKLNLRLSQRISQRIEEAGYCVEPDPRFGGDTYDWGQTVLLFKLFEGDPAAASPAYVGAANLLRLSVFVAAADGRVDPQELQVFSKLIEQQLQFTKTELKRLQLLERVLTEDVSTAVKRATKVAKSIPVEKRPLIAKVLVRLAAVDGAITKGEYSALERIFKIFEIPHSELERFIREVRPPSEEITIEGPTTESGGEPIPQPFDQQRPQFVIDMTRVLAITTETKEVIGLLSAVLSEEHEQLPNGDIRRSPAKVELLASRPQLTANPQQIDRFPGLDASYHSILDRLLAREVWPRSEFCALAGEANMMPLKVCDAINEWSDEALGDFLLEGEDPVVVHRNLILKEKS